MVGSRNRTPFFSNHAALKTIPQSPTPIKLTPERKEVKAVNKRECTTESKNLSFYMMSDDKCAQWKKISISHNESLNIIRNQCWEYRTIYNIELLYKN